MLGTLPLSKVIDTGCEVINLPGRKHIAGDQGVKPSGPCGDILALVMGVYVPYSVVAVLNDLAVTQSFKHGLHIPQSSRVGSIKAAPLPQQKTQPIGFVRRPLHSLQVLVKAGVVLSLMMGPPMIVAHEGITSDNYISSQVTQQGSSILARVHGGAG